MSVLISGAGVAGPTLASWLARHGFRVAVAECASGQRSSGNPVDIKGSDPAAAYERRHRLLTRRRQRGVFTASAMLQVPQTQAGIAVRNTAVRFMRS